jgi:phage gpG-like protein
MDGMRITLDDTALLRAIDSAVALLARPRGLLEEIGATVQRNAQLRFDTKTDPAGTAWPPLSPATKAIYESDWFIERNPAFKGGIPGSLLERTRQLRNSLAYNVGPQWVDIGTSRRVPGKSQPYWEVGVLHEWGTRTMPRRGILTADPERGELGAEDRADILQVVQDAIEGAFD